MLKETPKCGMTSRDIDRYRKIDISKAVKGYREIWEDINKLQDIVRYGEILII